MRAGQTDENGLRTLVARARAGDVTVLVAVIDRIAAILSDRGDTDPVDVRRATALRVLANPAEALELLASAALQHLERLPDERRGAAPRQTGAEQTGCRADGRRADRSAEQSDGAGDALAAHRRAAGEGERSDGRFVGRPEEWIGWMRDSSGRHLPPNCMRGDLESVDLAGPDGDRASVRRPRTSRSSSTTRATGDRAIGASEPPELRGISAGPPDSDHGPPEPDPPDPPDPPADRRAGDRSAGQRRARVSAGGRRAA